MLPKQLFFSQPLSTQQIILWSKLHQPLSLTHKLQLPRFLLITMIKSFLLTTPRSPSQSRLLSVWVQVSILLQPCLKSHYQSELPLKLILHAQCSLAHVQFQSTQRSKSAQLDWAWALFLWFWPTFFCHWFLLNLHLLGLPFCTMVKKLQQYHQES